MTRTTQFLCIALVVAVVAGCSDDEVPSKPAFDGSPEVGGDSSTHDNVVAIDGNLRLDEVPCGSPEDPWSLLLAYDSIGGAKQRTLAVNADGQLSVTIESSQNAADGGAPNRQIVNLTASEERELKCLVGSDFFLSFMTNGFACSGKIFDANEAFVFDTNGKRFERNVTACTLAGDTSSLSGAMAKRISNLIAKK